MTASEHISALKLADLVASSQVTVIDVREPMEFVGGHIAGSVNVPVAKLSSAELPAAPLALVCQSGARSTRALVHQAVLRHGYPAVSLQGGITAWQEAGLPVRKRAQAPLPLMRQVQIAAGSLVLLGVVLSQSVASAWILLSAFVGAGLIFAGISGFCGMARILAVLPWNRVTS